MVAQTPIPGARCGARKRDGHSCMNWPRKGRTRCKFHGGNWNPETVNRTIKNWRPSLQVRMAHAALRRALGIPPPSLNNLLPKLPPKTVAQMKDELVAKIEFIEEGMVEAGVMPGRAVVGTRDPGSLTMPELLGEVGQLSLMKLHHLLSKDREIRDTREDSATYGQIVKPMDLRVERFESELAQGCLKIFVRVAEVELRGRTNDKLSEILAAINESEEL
jgi:hypothetical protein